MPTQHGAVGNGIVLRRGSFGAAGYIFARLDGDTIVPYTNMAVADVHIFAGFRIDAISIG